MPTFLILPSGLRQDFVAAVTDIIEVAGRSCRLFYPSIMIDCPDCTAPVGGYSSNYFENGTTFNSLAECASCGGSHTIEKEASYEDVTMLVRWNPQKWWKSPITDQMQLNTNYGFVLTRGFLTDLPKIRKANYMVLNSPITDYEGGRFVLDGEPVDENNYGAGNFLSAIWRRDS